MCGVWRLWNTACMCGGACIPMHTGVVCCSWRGKVHACLCEHRERERQRENLANQASQSQDENEFKLSNFRQKMNWSYPNMGFSAEPPTETRHAVQLPVQYQHFSFGKNVSSAAVLTLKWTPQNTTSWKNVIVWCAKSKKSKLTSVPSPVTDTRVFKCPW